MAQETVSLPSSILRYSVTTNSFVKDSLGAWVSFTDHYALVTKLENRIKELEKQIARHNQVWWTDNEA